MKRMILVMIAMAALVSLTATTAKANVWVNEDFEDGIAFDHADGNDTGGALDFWDYDNTTNPATQLTATGSVTTERSLESTTAYKMVAGQGIAVVEPFKNPANGPAQYFQFGVSVDDVPAAADVSMGKFNWPWMLNGAEYNFFVELVSDGSGGVDIVAGQDLNTTDLDTSATIGNIPSSDAGWRFITIQFIKNQETVTDSRLGDFTQGIRFFVSSLDPALELVPAGAADLGDTSRAWSFSVTDGTVFVDNFYWEGAVASGYEENGALRNLTTVPVEISSFIIE